jgi:hypothetical protein
MKNLIIKAIYTVMLLTVITSCEKPPGPGGKATIKGKVYVVDFDNTQYYHYGEGYAPGERVYICYGDNDVVGNDVRTGINGEFEFRHLNKGKYRVFVNTVDTSKKNKGNDRMLPVIKDVTIKGTSEVITLEDFIISK